MGADQKRKEARKRKFAGRSGPAESKIETAFAATSPGEDTTEQPAAKKIKASKEPKPPDQRPREAHDVADGGAEDISSSVVQPADQQIDESIQDQPDTKSQRFIVFIGRSPSPYDHSYLPAGRCNLPIEIYFPSPPAPSFHIKLEI